MSFGDQAGREQAVEVTPHGRRGQAQQLGQLGSRDRTVLQNSAADTIAGTRFVPHRRGRARRHGGPCGQGCLSDFHAIIVTLFFPALKEGQPYRP